ncbi:MAG: UrcA family protein [Alphaproteobacteria bacterium]
MFKRLIPLSVLILSIGAVSVSASAKDTSNTVKVGASESTNSTGPSVKINYSDLDVSTQAGAKVLLSRIRNVADRLCGYYPENDLGRRADHMACVRATVNEAVAEVDNPVLTAVNGSAQTPAG